MYGEFKLITRKPSTNVINQSRITIMHPHTNYKLEKSRLGMQVQAALRDGGFALSRSLKSDKWQVRQHFPP